MSPKAANGSLGACARGEAVPRLVGILGGMGPAATVDLMQKVLLATPAERDEEHVPMVVWNVPQVPSRPAALRGEGPSPLPRMLEGARRLEASGATAIAIACNTAHHWADEMGRALSIPILHIADAAIEALAAREPRPRALGLLGTRETLDSAIYRDRLAAGGFDVRVPNALEQAAIERAIAAVKAGRLEAARGEFLPAARAMLDRGADVLLLACTELPLVPCGDDVRGRSVDATEALARAIVRHAFAPCETPAPPVS